MTLQNPSPRWHAGRGQVIKADVDASLLPAPAAPSQGKVCAKHPELNGRRWKNGKCPACLREYKQRPDQRAKRRISNRRYRQSPEGRVKVKDRRQKRYRELSPDRYAKLLARNKRYHQSPKGRALLKRYRQSPERRESRRGLHLERANARRTGIARSEARFITQN